MNEPSAKEASSLGPLEQLVMDDLWDHGGELSPRQVHEHVGLPRNLAYTTILTILQRLYVKGLVRRSQRGRTHLYAPLLTRRQWDERRAQLLAESLVRIGDSGVAAFLSEAQRLDPTVIAALRKHLEEQR